MHRLNRFNETSGLPKYQGKKSKTRYLVILSLKEKSNIKWYCKHKRDSIARRRNK